MGRTAEVAPPEEVTVNRVAPPIQVDRNSPVPLYFQVAQHLEHLIESGELAPGTRLENEIDLADRLHLSRPTMRRAIEYLVDRGSWSASAAWGRRWSTLRCSARSS
jgi:DNA-binding transcriptional MocR family regulator